MEFWEEDRDVTGFFNHFLDEQALSLEIRLQLDQSLCTAIHGSHGTLLLVALHLEPINPKAMFQEHLLHPLWLIREFGVVLQEGHQLDDLFTISCEPPTPHPGLLTPRVQVHSGCEEGIF